MTLSSSKRDPRWFLALTLIALVAALVAALPSITVAHAASQASSSSYVTTDGAHFLQDGKPLALNGYTFYPATDGGSSAWHSASFTSFIDQTLTLGAQAGQNLARPTDYWSKSATGQSVTDPVLWSNMDYLVQQAQQRNVYVLMDLSAYKWLLISQGQDPYNADNWTPFLQFVAARYRASTAVLGYSIVGEPPFPRTQVDADAMVAFYAQVTNTLYAADPHHLISAGGFNNMEYGVGSWWQRIYALPHNDICAFKTYSQNDLTLMPAIAAYAQSIHKPLMDEEFGAPQSIGDAVWTGVLWGNFSGSRSQFYTDVYSEGDQLNVAAYIFWNLDTLLGPTRYDVSPLTPATWAVIAQHAHAGASSTPTPSPTSMPSVTPTVTPTSTPPPPSTGGHHHHHHDRRYRRVRDLDADHDVDAEAHLS